MLFRPASASAIAVLLIALSGCASRRLDVMTSFDPFATFPSQATFVWDDAANKLPGDATIRDLDLDPLIKQAANDAFGARGYLQARVEPADYRLCYEVGENRWYGPEGVTSVVSVSLLLKDPKSDRHVWLGFGRAEVQQGVAREERARRLRKAFDEMLEGFPPSGRQN